LTPGPSKTAADPFFTVRADASPEDAAAVDRGLAEANQARAAGDGRTHPFRRSR